ncbi:MAG: galactonate dehydratase [Clostridiales bacterium]|nr:galactonate dehydratase [Clostridiales bacterium]
MKITCLKLYQIPPRWLFLKIETDDGISGWGEPLLEGKAATVAALIKEEYAHLLVGRNPFAIEDIWQTLYRGFFYRGGGEAMSALSGVDQALWDIKGKALGVPAYELLGGLCRDKLKIYSWIGGDRPSDAVEMAEQCYETGCRAVKMNATEELHYIDSYEKIDAVVKRVAAIRDALGYKMDIAVDFHGRVHKPMSKVLADALTPFRLMFIEEPVLCENMEAFSEIARYTPTPIATGERLFTRWQFKNLLNLGAVDIVQPDLSHAGGLSECKKIAAMAEAYDVAVAPHCPMGPIALAACVQLDACTPNAVIQEQSLGIHYNKEADLLDYIKNREVFSYAQGFIDIPKGPGLGVEVDEERVKDAAEIAHDWKNPIWRNYDGTIAEW